MSKIRLLLADDHAVLRSGLRVLLETQEDMQVVAEAGDAATAVEQARTKHPDIVLLDVSMPGPPVGETIGRLLRARAGIRIIVLTMHDAPGYIRAALAAGASGYVVKKVADTELISAIRAVHRGRMFVDSPQAGEVWTSAKGPQQAPSISPRESEVLRLLAEGHTNQEAAAALRVSVKTIETHRSRLSQKLNLRTRADLYRFAVESGLLVDQPK
jgi:DNA-binding NarL/FixJ family response regulator